jgi:adenylyltransferase/sulfurtransferase
VSVLVIGAGGLATPVLTILARSVDTAITIIDDDVIDETNLHRQLLYQDRDVGRPKLEVARERVLAMAAETGHTAVVRTIEGRFTPENALSLAREHTLIVEGADNLATKFLAADAARLAERTVVQAGVVRWAGWALASSPGRGACLRCIFEDVPTDRVETCATAGVVGSVVGVVGALAASLAIRALAGDDVGGALYHHDALAGSLRQRRAGARPDCPLCGARASIRAIDETRYASAACAL